MSECSQGAPADGYMRELPCRTPRERVFETVATLGGLRGWWTPIVAGSVRPGGHLSFGFEDLDEAIVMRVDELRAGSCLRWTCLEHTGAADWAGTTIGFELRDAAADQCVLTFTHTGVPADQVAGGWDRFLASLTRLVETGRGEPYQAPSTDAPHNNTEDADALNVARAYHAAWTSRDFDTARSYLAVDLHTDVPINTYAGRDDFVAALTSFGGPAQRVELLTEFGCGEQALLLYDVHTEPFGPFRIAEQFTVHDGLIRRIRHVHETAALRGTA